MRFIDRGAGEYIDHLFDRLMGDRRARKILDLDTTPAPSTRTGAWYCKSPRARRSSFKHVTIVEFSRRRFSGFLADQQAFLTSSVRSRASTHQSSAGCQSFDGHPRGFVSTWSSWRLL